MRAFLRPEEVAVRLGMSPWTVYDLARRGVLPAVRIGRSVRIRPAVLEDFLAERESCARSPLPSGRRAG